MYNKHGSSQPVDVWDKDASIIKWSISENLSCADMETYGIAGVHLFCIYVKKFLAHVILGEVRFYTCSLCVRDLSIVPSVSIRDWAVSLCRFEGTLYKLAALWACPSVWPEPSSHPLRGRPPLPGSSAAPPAGQRDGADAAGNRWSGLWRAWARGTPSSAGERARTGNRVCV